MILTMSNISKIQGLSCVARLAANALLISVGLIGPSLSALAQWSTGSSGAIYYNGGNVGVGTSSPGSVLTVAGGEYNSGLQVTSSSTAGTGIQLYNTATSGHAWDIFSSGPGLFLGSGGLGIYDETSGSYRFVITASGNVGIDTYDPQNTLSVNTTVQAKEVVVNTGWSDFVFAPDYHLVPLSEIKDYVSANHHLPDIPSAAEVDKNGVNLGEMESKLLAKVEELTLHMIAAEERSKLLEEQNRDLRRRLERVESRTDQKDSAGRE